MYGADGRPGGRGRDGRPLTRRRLLAGIGAAGLGGAAGCAGLEPDESLEPTVDADAWHGTFAGSLLETGLTQPSGTLERFVSEVGFARDPESREPVSVLASGFDESESTVSVTLRPDLAWSNGDPLTAADLGRWLYMYRTGSSWFAPVPAVRDGDRRPRSRVEAITEIEWDDRTLTVTGEFGTVGRPLSDLSQSLGRYPRAYYDALWEAFRDSFADVPWEDEETRSRVADLVDANIFGIGDELLPEAGIALEDEYDGDGWEAAYSGLWYPRHAEDAQLYFARNDAHPFADRTDLEEVVWTFRQDPGRVREDLQEGVADGAARTAVTERLLDSLPDSYETVTGSPRRVSTVALNHQVDRFADRDVRAALLYAIDREAVAESANLATVDPVAVPGADLQSAAWVPSEFRASLRRYEHDPDRAAALLEDAGFTREGGSWRTPEGERFAVELVSAGLSPWFGRSVVGALDRFGIDATRLVIEETSYQTRLRGRAFYAAPSARYSSNAAGYRRNRASEYVAPIARANGFRNSGFLEATVEEAVDDRDDLSWVDDGVERPKRLAYDSVESLRAITVPAPPLGDPDGDLREWPYLYHAVRVAGATDESERREHGRICTWIYNYQVPALELVTNGKRIVHDATGWELPPPDDSVWRYVPEVTQPGGLWAALGWGHIDRA